jgi:dCTP deaminase
MILSAQSIQWLCDPHRADPPMIEPFFNSKQITRGMSFGLSSAGYDVRCATALVLHPHDFALVVTIERFIIPNDILAQVVDKSTWARRGLAVQNTVFDPGFQGFGTLELSNNSRETLVIESGDPIAQFLFIKLDEATDRPYRGKYQNQPAEPVPARDEPEER